MSEFISVSRTLRAVSAMIGLVASACDTSSLAPTAIAANSPAPSIDVIDDQSANVKAGLYDYGGGGCFTEVTIEPGFPLPPPTVTFDPPVCLPLTLEVFETGSWGLLYPYSSYTTPDHPGWVFSVGDIWLGVSRNGKCRHSGEPYGGGCVSETRYAKSMTFSTSMVFAQGNGANYRASSLVYWTYNHGKP